MVPRAANTKSDDDDDTILKLVHFRPLSGAVIFPRLRPGDAIPSKRKGHGLSEEKSSKGRNCGVRCINVLSLVSGDFIFF